MSFYWAPFSAYTFHNATIEILSILDVNPVLYYHLRKLISTFFSSNLGKTKFFFWDFGKKFDFLLKFISVWKNKGLWKMWFCSQILILKIFIKFPNIFQISSFEDVNWRKQCFLSQVHFLLFHKKAGNWKEPREGEMEDRLEF